MVKWINHICSILIILEMTVTGLGYCGHDHDHGDFIHASEEDGLHEACPAGLTAHTHSHSNDCADHHKTHCSCLGDFIGDLCLVPISFHLSLFDTVLIQDDACPDPWRLAIYQPPVFAS